MRLVPPSLHIPALHPPPLPHFPPPPSQLPTPRSLCGEGAPGPLCQGMPPQLVSVGAGLCSPPLAPAVTPGHPSQGADSGQHSPQPQNCTRTVPHGTTRAGCGGWAGRSARSVGSGQDSSSPASRGDFHFPSTDEFRVSKTQRARLPGAGSTRVTSSLLFSWERSFDVLQGKAIKASNNCR